MDNFLLRDKIMSFVNVIMRVPPLFLIDGILRNGLSTAEPISLNNDENDFNLPSVQTIVESIAAVTPEPFFLQHFNINSYVYQAYVLTILRFLASCCSIVGSLYVFMMWTGHLLILYMYFVSVLAIFLSYWSNVATMNAIIAYTSSYSAPSSILDDILSLKITKLMDGPGILIVQNYLLQSLLAAVFCYIHMAPRHPVVQKLLTISFLAPSIIGICPLTTSLLHHAPVCAALLPLALCKFVIWYNFVAMSKVIDDGFIYARNFISNYGLSALAETGWVRLNVPNVLRTFWLLRVGGQVLQMLGTNQGEETLTFYVIIRMLLVNGCETLTALLGMTSIISSICHYIDCFFRWVLLTSDDDEKSMGTVSAILFYILALQTGLTSLDKEKRLVRLLRNFCLLSTALLHFIHNIVNPVLMSLSASHNPAVRRHVGALGVCLFLIVFPVTLLTIVWTHFTMSTWVLAVSIFSIEVIVKVVVSLAVYSLFLFDAYRSTFWEQLDDCLYIIRSFGNTVEFTFGVILFFNGVWILLFESGGAIRAVMMGIHAYFNIWNEAKAGWSVFIKRRTAVNKINSLPEAREEQLKRLDDVCAICYQEMKTAKVTRCNHYFHGVCLRKWLYIQDECPLCHDILYQVESPLEKADEPEILERLNAPLVNDETQEVNENLQYTMSVFGDNRRESRPEGQTPSVVQSVQR